MKGTLVVVVLTLSVLSTPAWAEDSDLRLELETGLRTLRLGQETRAWARDFRCGRMLAGLQSGRTIETRNL